MSENDIDPQIAQVSSQRLLEAMRGSITEEFLLLLQLVEIGRLTRTQALTVLNQTIQTLPEDFVAKSLENNGLL